MDEIKEEIKLYYIVNKEEDIKEDINIVLKGIIYEGEVGVIKLPIHNFGNENVLNNYKYVIDKLKKLDIDKSNDKYILTIKK